MKLFGKYEVLEEVGAGAIGSRVFRTRDKILQREAFVKAFSIDGMTPAAKQRFFREVQASAQLSHPNIVSIYDVAEQDEYAYIAMEQLEGDTLHAFVQRQPALPLEARLRFMVEICEGLAFAHENAVFHRDLKPTNIFILKSGRPKILDFAIIRAFTVKSLPAGTIVGTPEYMSPEQFKNLRGDARSDIFSISVIFFELLTGRHPFPGKDIAHEVQNDAAPVITDLNSMLPRRLANLIAKGLAKDPAARVQTAAEFTAELKGIAAEIPTLSSTVASNVAGLGEKIGQLQTRIQAGPPELQERLAQVDVSILERLTPQLTATLASEQDYFSIADLQTQALSTLESLEQIVLESKPAAAPVTTAESERPVAAMKAAAAAPGASLKTAEPTAPAPPTPDRETPAEAKKLPTVEEKLSELALATKIGDVRDILAITDEINQYKKDWFGENPDSESGLETVQASCRKALDAVVEISQSHIHTAISRNDINAAQEEFRNIEQAVQKDAHYTELAGQINKQIQDLIARQDQPKRRLPSSDSRPAAGRNCPTCGKPNSDTAVLCESCGTKLPGGAKRVPRVVVPKEVAKKSSPTRFLVPGVIVMVVAIVAYVFIPRGDPNVLGTARVAKTALLRAQIENTEGAKELGADQEVEFLKQLPAAKEDAWAEVQIKGGSRGFIKVSDLKSVNTKSCAFNLWHVGLLLGNTQNLRANDLQDRTEQVKSAMDNCRPKDTPDDLRMNLAEAYGQLVTMLGKDAGQPQVTQANLQLNSITNKGAYSDRIKAVQDKIATRPIVGEQDRPRKPQEKPPVDDTFKSPTDPFEILYNEAKIALDSANITPAELTSILSKCDKIINARFTKQHGQDLQQRAKALRGSALDTLCEIDKGNLRCKGK